MTLSLQDKNKIAHEVESFLIDFKQKMRIWDVLFRDDRAKNFETLAKLEITPLDRKKVLENLEKNDYCKGPLEDTLYKSTAMWVFGKSIKKQEVYIKISMGAAGSSVICISFHLAAHPMSYPLK